MISSIRYATREFLGALESELTERIADRAGDPALGFNAMDDDAWNALIHEVADTALARIEGKAETET